MIKKQVWKQTEGLITQEPLDMVIREIREATSMKENMIEEKLYNLKELVCIPGARFHIYRDSLG